MWKDRAEVEAKIRSLFGTRLANIDEATAFGVFDGLESIDPLKTAVAKWRERGVKRIIVGVGVMPSRLVEPAKALVDELMILKVPRHFRAIGQYFEGTK